MRMLPELVFRVAFVFLTVHFVPHYGDVISALFSQVSDGLSVVQWPA